MSNVQHEEMAFRTANKAILQQIGQPPPTAVLTATVEAVGGEPDVVAADVSWGEGETTWDVYACRGNVIAHVRGHKDAEDWRGGNSRDQHGPADVTANARRISAIRSIKATGLTTIPSFEGFHRSCQATWTVEFDDGHALELDETTRYGEHVQQISRHLRDIFLAADSRS